MTRYAFLLLALPCLAFAAGPDECHTGTVPADMDALHMALYRPLDKARLFLHRDSPGCPSDTLPCRLGPSAAPGEHLLVGPVLEGWTCAHLTGSGATGWVLARDLVIEARSTPQPADWIGTWSLRGTGNTIRIARAGQDLRAAGLAPARAGMPVGVTAEVNTGSFEGVLTIDGSTARVTESDENAACAVDMVRAGPFLAVLDNGSCGGLSVRFNGIYSRRHR